MIDEANERTLSSALDGLVRSTEITKLKKLKAFKDLNVLELKVKRDDFQTVKVQLRALGLITKNTKNRSVKDTATYWTLTPYGDNQLTRLRAIRRPET